MLHDNIIQNIALGCLNEWLSSHVISSNAVWNITDLIRTCKNIQRGADKADKQKVKP